MKKKNVKSKFNFVKIDVRNAEVAEEIKKVNNIIHRFLITYQWRADGGKWFFLWIPSIN